MGTKLFKTIIIVLLLVYNSLSAQWQELNSGVATTLTSVSVHEYPFTTCWICGNNGTVIKSSFTYPLTFKSVNYGIPSNINLVNIFAVDSGKAFTAGNIGNTTYVYRTINGGYNWSVVFSQANGLINALWMRNTVLGIMVGNPVGGRWSIWKTSNGGLSWDSTGLYLPQAGNETGWPNSLYFIDSSYGYPVRRLWFGTNNSRIYYSTNWGGNWIVQSTSPEVNSMTLLFNGSFFAGNGVLGGGSLMRTSNYGYNWTNVPGILGSGNITGLAGNNPGIDAMYPYTWYVRNDNNIYYTSNMGFNWVVQYSSPSGSYKFVNQQRPGGFGNIFAVRNNGGISHCDCTPSVVKKISQSIPEAYTLSQNYPNPFNPVTSIKFDLPKSGFVKLVIYGLLGREITQLVNRQLQAGSYSVDWDASNYPSGIYFYTLEAGDYKQTRKMVLIK